jgi:ACT domain-containing protein
MPSTSNQTEDGFCTFKEAKEVPTMSVAKEFTVLMEDRPSTLGKVCRALADREVDILALQSLPIGGKA